jgi:hypothetical protein
MKSILSGQAAKLVVALIGTAATVLSHWSSKWWEPVAVSVLTAVAVYLVPNAPSSTNVPPPAK